MGSTAPTKGALEDYFDLLMCRTTQRTTPLGSLLLRITADEIGPVARRALKGNMKASLRTRGFRFFERRLVNRLIRRLVISGRAPDMFALIETLGRKSGTPRLTPVGNGLKGDTFWLVAEQGLMADYVKNILREPRVRVHANGVWRTGTATVVIDDDPIARSRLHPHKLDAAFLRLIIRGIGTLPVTVRVDLTPESQH